MQPLNEQLAEQEYSQPLTLPVGVINYAPTNDAEYTTNKQAFVYKWYVSYCISRLPVSDDMGVMQAEVKNMIKALDRYWVNGWITIILYPSAIRQAEMRYSFFVQSGTTPTY